MDNRVWHVVYTSPRAEKKVHSELLSKGFESYLPLQKTMRVWSDRKKKIEVPLFNSYVFVKIDFERSSQEILNIPGIVKFVKFGREIARIRDSQIEQIKLLLDNFEGLLVENLNRFEKGQKVEVIAGPLMGSSGILTERKGTHHFAIDLEQIGTQILVTLPVNYLRQV